MEILLLALNVILIVWIFFLSYIVFKIYKQFTQLTNNVRGENLMKILEKVLLDEKENSASIEETRKVIENMQKQSHHYIQKVGMVRFNPFTDTGGEQSFTLGLLDKDDNGVILTGLHTRERTRVYIKPITHGQSKIELSKEEQKALKEATS